MIREDADRQRIADMLIGEVSAAETAAVPYTVVGRLKTHGFREDKIRAVMWSLIDMRKLTMTPEWLLTLPKSDAPVIAANGHQ